MDTSKMTMKEFRELPPPTTEEKATEALVRLTTLEERFEKLIEAIDKSKRVKNI